MKRSDFENSNPGHVVWEPRVKVKWLDIGNAPKTGNPFWLGTGCGGVLLEAWHWCSEKGDFAGIFTETTMAELRAQSPQEKFYYAEMVAPRRDGVQ